MLTLNLTKPLYLIYILQKIQAKEEESKLYPKETMRQLHKVAKKKIMLKILKKKKYLKLNSFPTLPLIKHFPFLYFFPQCHPFLHVILDFTFSLVYAPSFTFFKSTLCDSTKVTLLKCKFSSYIAPVLKFF